MNAPLNKSELNFVLPNSLSFAPDVEEGYRNAAEAQLAYSQTLARRFGDVLAKVVAYFRRGEVMTELSSMSDRELADIGLSRGNLTRVFDADFAQEHRSRAY
jgi:uncharacterized protein YjiS (DUF1127 family)